VFCSYMQLPGFDLRKEEAEGYGRASAARDRLGNVCFVNRRRNQTFIWAVPRDPPEFLKIGDLK
jgi:hypothetical protein